MARGKIETGFQAMLERIHEATGARTQQELALLLGIRQSSVSDAKRRESLPADWLLTLLRTHYLNPDWILTGALPVYLGTGLSASDAGPCIGACPALKWLEMALHHIRGCTRARPARASRLSGLRRRRFRTKNARRIFRDGRLPAGKREE